MKIDLYATSIILVLIAIFLGLKDVEKAINRLNSVHQNAQNGK